jgi:hypothetical protein
MLQCAALLLLLTPGVRVSAQQVNKTGNIKICQFLILVLRYGRLYMESDFMN